MKEEIGKIENGKIEKEWYVQGYIYKSFKAFKSKKGVCYVPEMSDQKYTYKDFLRIAKNNPELAYQLLDCVDYQHPETLMDEWENGKWD